MKFSFLCTILYALGISGSVFCLMIIMMQRGDFYLLFLPVSNLCFAVGYRLEKADLIRSINKGVISNGKGN